MKRAARLAALLAAVLVVLAGLLFAASESGEVAVATTFDERGDARRTRLWIVDFEGDAYLRAGSPDVGWFARVQANPIIVVERGGESFHALAVIEEHRRAEINALMGLKYGLADMLIGQFFPRSQAVAIRLAPR